MMILVFLGIGLFVYFMMHSDHTNNNNFKATESSQISPIALLELRFAKGEIDEVTFNKMKETLTH